MAETFTHGCIKCHEQYQSTDIDPYYCPTCNEQRKIIAKQIDSKLSTVKSKRHPKSDFQVYDEMCRRRGTAFVPIKDLGIKL